MSEPEGGSCLGIDEAGRGPVLGPMVYGAWYTPLSNETELSKLGFAGQKYILSILRIEVS